MTRKITHANKLTLFVLLAIFLIRVTNAGAQSYSDFSREIEFISHLQDDNEFTNSIYLAKKIDTLLLTQSQKDSLNYYEGWAYYNLRLVDTSATYLQKISEASPFYYKSTFYTANNYSYTKEYDKALKAINKNLADTGYRQLQLMQQSAIFLLKRNYKSFDSTAAFFNYANFNVADGQKEMLMYEKKLKSYKKKSPFLAGLYSAIIPGSGKYYAGKKGQAVATFLTCFISGLVAAENFYRGGFIKDGYKSPQFIVTGAIFGVFYLGNIWGSVVSVKLARQSFNNTKDNEIRVSVHLPLRRIFN